jgi:sulfite exporter TauE/SafE
MCGPLVLLTPVAGPSPQAHIASRLLYHAGRLSAYACIGILFGLIGESLVFVGLQRWLSIAVGMALIIALLFSAQHKSRLNLAPRFIKKVFGAFLHKRTYPSIFALGGANGLLPCGLVYMAATASIASGSASDSAVHMLAFGLGTLPMLLAISFAGARINFLKIPALQKLAPIAVASIAILLIVRADPISLLKQPSEKFACPACEKN